MTLNEKFTLLGILEAVGDMYAEKYEYEGEDVKEKRREVLKILKSEENKQLYWESLGRDFRDCQTEIVSNFSLEVKDEILKNLT